MYSNQFIEMKRMYSVTANGSVCTYNKQKPSNLEAAHVASARLCHAGLPLGSGWPNHIMAILDRLASCQITDKNKVDDCSAQLEPIGSQVGDDLVSKKSSSMFFFSSLNLVDTCSTLKINPRSTNKYLIPGKCMWTVRMAGKQRLDATLICLDLLLVFLQCQVPCFTIGKKPSVAELCDTSL